MLYVHRVDWSELGRYISFQNCIGSGLYVMASSSYLKCFSPNVATSAELDSDV